MKFASKIVTEHVFRNALYLTCVMKMKSNVAKQIFQLVYGPIALEMMSAFQITVNVIQIAFFYYMLKI